MQCHCMPSLEACLIPPHRVDTHRPSAVPPTFAIPSILSTERKQIKALPRSRSEQYRLTIQVALRGGKNTPSPLPFKSLSPSLKLQRTVQRSRKLHLENETMPFYGNARVKKFCRWESSSQKVLLSKTQNFMRVHYEYGSFSCMRHF